ncbi:Crp/Fnr family transcriptional regulator [Brochothrix campestris]|uniref:Crp/Fnr family transcriptional regulator n=1 Tax=Brochothrix campestris TaxID=2757 RepID=UPI0038D1FC03
MHPQILTDYITRKQPPLITKKKNSYLAYDGDDIRYVDILKTGIVKISTILKDGREFNIAYKNSFEIITLMNDEEDAITKAPYNVRIESDTAAFYRIDRVSFWEDAMYQQELLLYVKEFYRSSLAHMTTRLQHRVMNGKKGALCALLIELAHQFGEETDRGLHINLAITNEDIAAFCGISSDTSVSRMLRDLREQKAIHSHHNHLYVTNLAYLQEFVAY